VCLFRRVFITGSVVDVCLFRHVFITGSVVDVCLLLVVL